MWQKSGSLWQLNPGMLSPATCFYPAWASGERRSGLYRIPIIFCIIWVKLKKMVPEGHHPYPVSALETESFIVLCISEPHPFSAALWERSLWSELYHLKKYMFSALKEMPQIASCGEGWWLTYKGLETTGTWEAGSGNADKHLLTYISQMQTPILHFWVSVGLSMRETTDVLTSLEIPWWKDPS